MRQWSNIVDRRKIFWGFLFVLSLIKTEKIIRGRCLRKRDERERDRLGLSYNCVEGITGMFVNWLINSIVDSRI